MSIANNLRAARAAAGKTQEQVALYAGMNVTQYNAYERERSRPSMPVLLRLAKALGTNSQALLSDGGESYEPIQSVENVDRRLADLRETFCAQVAALIGLKTDKVVIKIELA